MRDKAERQYLAGTLCHHHGRREGHVSHPSMKVSDFSGIKGKKSDKCFFSAFVKCVISFVFICRTVFMNKEYVDISAK